MTRLVFDTALDNVSFGYMVERYVDGRWMPEIGGVLTPVALMRLGVWAVKAARRQMQAQGDEPTKNAKKAAKKKTATKRPKLETTART